MSVPRPAMLVEIVTAPGRPACRTMAASASSCRALRTWCGMLACSSVRLSVSDSTTLAVPTSTGLPASCASRMRAARAACFSARVVHTTSGRSTTHDRTVRRHDDDLEAVDLPELGGLGGRGARHAAHAGIEGDEALERDRAEDPPGVLDGEAFLGLDRGLEPLRPAAETAPAGPSSRRSGRPSRRARCSRRRASGACERAAPG